MNARLVLAAAAAAVIAALLTPPFRRLALAFGIVDRPNERSSHQGIVARAGGLVLLLAFAAGVALTGSTWEWKPGAGAIAGGVLLVAGVGLWDDHAGVSPWLRLLVHSASALLVVASVARTNDDLPGRFGVPLAAWVLAATIWIVAVVNFYNFLDGIDGLAGSQGLITGIGLALAGWDPFASACGAAIAGACAGFLVHNWAPARIFMGDVGSGALGFLFASAALLAPPERQPQAVFFVAVSLWLFLGDATWTLLRRIARGERWYEAHRQHLYQRLVVAGWSHARVTLTLAVGAAALTAAALAAWHAGTTLSVAGAALLAVAALATEWALARRATRLAAATPSDGALS